MSYRRDVLFFVLYVCASILVITNCQLCENTSSPYLYSSMTVTCKNLQGQFPTFPKTVTSMKCFDCNIPVLSETTVIANFRGESFNLSHSHVNTISARAFSTFQNATHKFIFENNDITSIGKKVFSNFSQLQEINLKRNNISYLEDGTFEDTGLNLLDLSQNHIRNIDKMFGGLKVNRLNLSLNEIVDISQDAFHQTIFWKGRQWNYQFPTLDLSNNLIFKIQPGTFKPTNSDSISNIQTLYLQNNKLTAIENNTFQQSKQMRYLSLESNYISELYPDSFKGLTDLTTLILKNNKLRTIPPGMFADFQKLDNLDISENSLTTLSPNTFTGLVYLTKLNISHNNLKKLDESHIFPLGRITSLDISDTKLKDLNLSNILEHHYKLRVLVINDNFWTCKHLVEMYKEMNKKMGGFNYASLHFDVPNLHGIACSRSELNSYNDMTFDDFLGVIAQDRVFEDLFDARISNEYSDKFVGDKSISFKYLSGIYYMVLVITLIILMLFLQFIVRCVFRYLYTRNIISNGKFSFAYNSSQSNVELI